MSNFTTADEWMIRLPKGRESTNVQTAILYRVFFDDDDQIVKVLLVAADDQNEQHSAVLDISTGKVVRANYVCADSDDFDDEISDEDLESLKVLSNKLLSMVDWGFNEDDVAYCTLIDSSLVNEDTYHENVANSEQWAPDDLIEPITDVWNINIRF